MMRMSIQLYGRAKSAATRKAERFLKERRTTYQFVDLTKTAPGARELELFAEVLGAAALIDPNSAAYRKRGMSYLEFDPLEEIAEDVSLLRVPIMRSGRTVVIGEDVDGWTRLVESDGAG